MKYLIWLVVILAVVVWLQRAKKSISGGNTQAPGDGAFGRARGTHNPQSPQKAPETQVEVMVQCAHCGIHFPESEALTHSSGAHFCSQEHLRLGAS